MVSQPHLLAGSRGTRVGALAVAHRTAARSTDAGLLVAIAGTLPLLRNGLDRAAAEALVSALLRELAIDAAAIVAGESVIAYQGAGSDHHEPGRPYRMLLTGRALASKRTIVARGSRAVGCAVPSCTMTSGVAAPIESGGKVIGAVVLLRAERRPLAGSVRRGAAAVARFLGEYVQHRAMSGDATEPLRRELARAQRYDTPVSVSVFRAADVPTRPIDSALRGRARAADIVAALDERCAVLIQSDTALPHARVATARLSLWLGEDLGTAITTGIAAYPDHTSDAAGLLSEAMPA